MNAGRASKRREAAQLIKDNKDLLSLAQSIQAGMPKGNGVPLTHVRCMMVGLRVADIIASTLLGATRPKENVYSAARKQVIDELHCSRATVDEIWQVLSQAQQGGQDLGNSMLLHTSSRADGRVGSGGFKPTVLKCEWPTVDQEIQDYLIPNSIYVTGKSVKALVQEKLGKTISVRSAQRLIRRLGYTYGPLKKRYVLTPQRLGRVKKFLLEYSAAKALEDAGTHVIVNMDESYVHESHSRKYGYSVTSAQHGDEYVNGRYVHHYHGQEGGVDCRLSEEQATKGRRLIIVHAATKDGLLVGDAGDCERDIDSTVIGRDYKSAEWVYQADARLKDYHKNMNSEMFINWVRHMLVPAFKQKYPGKTMILFLDNAPYHKKSPAGNIVTTGKGITKAVLCDYADSLTPPLDEITVERDGQDVVFARDTFSKTGGRNAPTVAELADAVWRAAKQRNPERCNTILENIADEFCFLLLWGAPYSPKFAIVERIWGFSKNSVAALYHPDRTISGTAVDLFMTWYGGMNMKTGDTLEGLTASTVSKMHASCIRDMNDYIAKHGQAMGLSGTIGDLTDAAIDLTGDEDALQEIEEEDDDDDDDDGQFILEEED